MIVFILNKTVLFKIIFDVLLKRQKGKKKLGTRKDSFKGKLVKKKRHRSKLLKITYAVDSNSYNGKLTKTKWF